MMCTEYKPLAETLASILETRLAAVSLSCHTIMCQHREERSGQSYNNLKGKKKYKVKNIKAHEYKPLVSEVRASCPGVQGPFPLTLSHHPDPRKRQRSPYTLIHQPPPPLCELLGREPQALCLSVPSALWLGQEVTAPQSLIPASPLQVPQAQEKQLLPFPLGLSAQFFG